MNCIAYRSGVFHLVSATFLLTSILNSCDTKSSSSEKYYSLSDFPIVKKIDAHVHIQTERPDIVEQAQEDNFTLISINTEVPDYPPISQQQDYILKQRKKFPNDIYYLTTFEIESRNEVGWIDRQMNYLKNSFNKGAIGIKVWKNIGMTIRDKDSNFIMIDNPMFDPIFNYLEENNIPVCGHIGEPKNCWLPIEKMTTNNDKRYFTRYPEYHMYLHPEYPSYEKLIQSRDHLLEKHPKLKFVGAHLGSLEWSVDEIAKRLDKFPNMSVDITERLGQLQYQSMQNWQKVHDFFMRYQNRILYGTDIDPQELQTPAQVKEMVHDIWVWHWKYFTSDSTLEHPFVAGKFKGLKLPTTVVDKIYHENAVKWYLNNSNK
ncbi:MAG: amidohydrolase family protein [Ferruginibacter sp.]